MRELAPALPTTIERGLGGIRSLAACELEGAPRFESALKRWVVVMSLRIENAGPFVGKKTRWSVLLDEAYPYGAVAFYPANDGGLTVTFPHQERNRNTRGLLGFRSGKLCLDSPFRAERRPTIARDPVGDAETRLRWHVERALDWLDSAASGRLLAAGDPFELPARPQTEIKEWAERRVIHDETTAEYSAWDGRVGMFGVARLGLLSEIGKTIGVEAFEDGGGTSIRTWTGRKLVDASEALSGIWWLWPSTIVLQPWQSPGTWGELRTAGKAIGVDVDGFLRRIAPSLRGSDTRTLLLLGYPIPTRVGALPKEVHWDAIVLPHVAAADGAPRGFRPSSRGWWQRDRQNAFSDRVAFEYVKTENWSGERLQARGRLSSSLRSAHIAILGVGALGANLAEQLVRGGVVRLALLDGDVVTAGNVCRHQATLVDVGKNKVRSVAERLLQISPAVRVTEIERNLGGDQRAVVEALEPFDVVIDCTASDEALVLLAEGWWPIPRLFASFSMGVGAKRVFSFGVTGHRFPQQKFSAEVGPWLDDEAATWGSEEEIFEGAGCWSPLFPARNDDVVMAAAICVKEIETLAGHRPREPRFRVFEKAESTTGFLGFSVREAPSLVAAAK